MQYNAANTVHNDREGVEERTAWTTVRTNIQYNKKEKTLKRKKNCYNEVGMNNDKYAYISL